MGVELTGWAFIILFSAAAIQDLVQLRISNIFFVLLVALFGLRVWMIGDYHVLQNIALFGIVFLVGATLFAKGWLGGGDVKLLAAAALWFDFGQGLSLLAAVALGGGVLALFLIVIRRMLPASLYARRGWPVLRPRGPIPYGMAIAVGAILCSQITGFHPAKRSYSLPPLQLPGVESITR